ncbi:hypothetical protein HID58_096214 [Brassica napus]|uniref:Pentatricopeptide repeat-containing protein n=1 Tax=Brassica napus TaxID=3708 RepID=A0ABQ7X154_BRANA|nr:hypothetical protein HID58_096214 [Brassica napus]
MVAHRLLPSRILLCSRVKTTPHTRLKPLKTLSTSPESETTPSSSDPYLVDKLCFSLNQANNNNNSATAASLRNHLIRLNPLSVVEVLYRCRDDLTLAQRFIQQLSLHLPNFKHTSFSLSAIIHILVRSGRLSDAQSCLLRMIRRSGVSRAEVVSSLVSTYSNCASNDSVFDLLIRTYVQARKLREAHEAFTLLRSKGYTVSIDACNALLGSLVRLGWVELAWGVYHDISPSGINVYTLNIMVNALCKDGQMDKVGSFLSQVQEKMGVYPDIVTYNTLISAYSSKGFMEEAFELMDAMPSKGFSPGVYTYNTVINGLCKHRRYERAKEVFAEMLESGLSPDSTTYRSLLMEACKKGDAVEVEEIFSDMRCRDVVPDLVCFSSVMSLFARSGDLDKALVFFDFVKDAGLVPDNVIYTVLIQGYCKKGMISEAMDLRNEMLRRGCCMDVVAYNTILHGLCKRKMLGDADKLFREMTERGLFPDSYTLTILIDGHCKLGNLQNAMELFKKMKEKRIRLDVVTYNTLLDGFGKVGDIDTAKEIWTDMVSREILPTPVSYSIMVNARCAAKAISLKRFGYGMR